MASLDFSYQNYDKLHGACICITFYLSETFHVKITNKKQVVTTIKLNGYFCRYGLFTSPTVEALLSDIRVRIKPFKELSHLA